MTSSCSSLVSFLLLLSSANVAVVDGNLDFFNGCGSDDAAPLTFGGSSTVEPVATAWSAGLKAKCPSKVMTVDGGGSSAGARRVCNADPELPAVDVGDMSRQWKTPDESTTADGWQYDCSIGDAARSVIQVAVANDGLSLAVAKGGIADRCITALGGLTKHQIRWMFSNMTLEQLVSDGGLPANAVSHSDHNGATRYWSELKDHPACPPTEIKISGPDPASGTYGFFQESILTAGEDVESFAGHYNSSTSDEVLAQMLEENTEGISFFSATYTSAHQDKLSTVKIENQFGVFVEPTADNIFTGWYSPLSRTIYMNVLNDPNVLERAKSFFEYGFSDEGTALVRDMGYVPLPNFKKVIMLTRLQANGGVKREDVTCGPAGDFKIAGASAVHEVAQIWGGVYSTLCPGSRVEAEAGGSSVGAGTCDTLFDYIYSDVGIFLGLNSSMLTPFLLLYPMFRTGRVCATRLESPVEIGATDRSLMVPHEATTENGVTFDCTGSRRSTIKVAVAHSGIGLVTKFGGAAEECIKTMDGLTIDQVRWIFSQFNEQELVDTDWAQEAVPNSDGNDETHLWSELHPDCPAVEIRIAGPTEADSAYKFIKNVVLTGDDKFKSETIDTNRPNGYYANDSGKELTAFLDAHDEAIAFVGFPFMFENLDVFSPVAIENDEGKFVVPTPLTIEDETYTPLSQLSYMNILKTEKSLAKTRPFIEFGLGAEGTRLVSIAGSFPLSTHESFVMRTKAGTASSIQLDEIECGPAGEITIAGSSTVRITGEVKLRESP